MPVRRSLRMRALGALGAASLVAGAWAPAGPHAAEAQAIHAALTAATAVGPCPLPLPAWSLSERINELLMVGGSFTNLPASQPEAAAGVGGFVMFGQPPAGSGPSIAAGLQSLDAAATTGRKAVPWMSTDEEGGVVQRLSNVLGALPSARQMAAQWTPAQVQSALAAHGHAMRSLGITMDLAPVLDTASPTNPIADENTRSFSESGQVAAAYGLAFGRGLLAGGVEPVVKHFPGLGHASADTDLGTAIDPPLSQLEANDLIPFDQAVSNGLPVVMVSHAIVPGLTGGRPASLAAPTYQFLASSLHFSGVTMTDDLNAGAIADAGYSQPAAAVAAIEAGADMAMIDASQWPATVSALENAVNAGAIPTSTIDADVQRVLTAKGDRACVVGMARTFDGNGYWFTDGNGAVAAAGDAQYYGSTGGLHLNAPIVGMAPTPDGHGYWLVGADGGIFTLGDAQYYGSTGGLHLNAPIVGMAPTPDGHGYWLVGADGGIFTLGDAHYYPPPARA
jgi:beta-N-acetylhexosaminidase